eukprot:885351-Pyramimonas_sp.AAC.1
MSRAAQLDVAGRPAGPAFLGVSSAAPRRHRGGPGGHMPGSPLGGRRQRRLADRELASHIAGEDRCDGQ